MKFSFIKTTVYLFFIIISTFFNACSKETGASIESSPDSKERGALISYQKTANLSSDEIAEDGLNIGDVSEFALKNVSVYRIIYNSVHKNDLKQVSGLVLIPDNVSSTLRLIQHHHGTIIPFSGSEEEVPSNYTGGMSESDVETSFIGAVFASNGYVVSLPDYAGYGHASDVEHPYTLHHELAEVSVDMIRATKILLETLSISFSNDVFLTGWSEGGGAGLATHKYLQLNYPEEFILKGTSVLAGPYDYFTFLSDVLKNNSNSWENLSIYNWAIYAMNSFTLTLNQPYSEIWRYSVTNQIDALNISSTIPKMILQASFIEGINNGENDAFINAVKENSLLDNWTPTGSLFFHSGTQDLIVPHYNSVNAHNRFEELGANSILYEYLDGDHYTPLYDYVITTIEDFNEIK